MHPESMDYGAYGVETTIKLRQTARSAIGHDVEFWDDEFNSIPSWPGSDESVQSKYIPRGIPFIITLRGGRPDLRVAVGGGRGWG